MRVTDRGMCLGPAKFPLPALSTNSGQTVLLSSQGAGSHMEPWQDFRK